MRVAMVAAALVCLESIAPAASADTAPDGRYFCGTYCNNRPPSYVIRQAGPGYGHRCDEDARVVDRGYPPADPYMWVWHMYSPRCQTTWVVAENTRAIGRRFCEMPEQYSTPVGCPTAGTSRTSLMWNDHSPTYAAINSGDVAERLSLDTWTVWNSKPY